jgi:uncharacterized protein (DUF1501 family)
LCDDHDDIDPARARLNAAAAEGCAESRLLLSRRSMLGVTAGLFSSAFIPQSAEAAGETEPRLLVVVLRGGMDGLSTVVPYGDLNYFSSRGELAMPTAGLIRLDSFFALHPSLRTFASMYTAGEASVIHAVAPPLRTRSHFDCQDNLESGLGGRSSNPTGWMNRLLAAMPTGTLIKTRGAIAVGEGPLMLRGSAPVMGWSPDVLAHVVDPTLYLIRSLYRNVDKGLYDNLESGLRTQTFAEGLGADPITMPELQKAFRGAGRLLGAGTGPRMAVMSVLGWDTHASQGGTTGVLADKLTELDQGLAAFKATVGAAWARTAVLIVTEFGRTVGNNGNKGTDHGVATVALMAGGAVAGTKVHANWPGLAPANLYDGRDLKPTTDLRSVFKGVLREHMAVPDAIINGTVFPDSLGVPPLQGLIKGA